MWQNNNWPRVVGFPPVCREGDGQWRRDTLMLLGCWPGPVGLELRISDVEPTLEMHA